MFAAVAAGCSPNTSQQENGQASDDLLAGWSVVSGSEGYFDNSQTVVEQTGNTAAADLSSVPARKLMQVDFDKVFKTEITHGEKYFPSGEGNSVAFTGADVIPSYLSDELAGALLNNKGDAFIAQYETGTTLEPDAFVSMTGAQDDQMTTYHPVKADVDNDGTDDIAVLVNFGGTGGFGELRVYKGADGGYRLTDTFATIIYSFHVLNYNGKNYICQDQYDYETKYFAGYMLLCCSGGRFAAQDLITLDVTDYIVSISFEDSGFEGIEDIRSTLVNKNIPRIFTANDDVIYGTSEEVLEKYYRFKCDIDNDGKEEIYEKMMHYPSNMGTLKYCYWYYYDGDGELIDNPDDKLYRLLQADTDIAENIYMFWVDKAGGKNVTYFYTDSADRFVLSAYVIS